MCTLSRLVHGHTTNLAKAGLLVSEANNKDAVCLSDAALGPGSHTAVCLIQNYTIDILLLCQPA